MTDFYEKWSLGFQKEKDINSICAAVTSYFINSVERQGVWGGGAACQSKYAKIWIQRNKESLSNWMSQKLTQWFHSRGTKEKWQQYKS